ncbi:hypothetical protein N658DRAFT_161559 [Parathielavia hyrcaniae]|uniref:Uncharacterized protein n=1 Tax=Parathielavia hyrcaniae TaxID=113614 RepID=A0AAN6PXG3_9PEZI|nr:hypothetical protein N658DRAFT_161559 [Parathielavia hyrcaniae]
MTDDWCVLPKDLLRTNSVSLWSRWGHGVRFVCWTMKTWPIDETELANLEFWRNDDGATLPVPCCGQCGRGLQRPGSMLTVLGHFLALICCGLGSGPGEKEGYRGGNLSGTLSGVLCRRVGRSQRCTPPPWAFSLLDETGLGSTAVTIRNHWRLPRESGSLTSTSICYSALYGDTQPKVSDKVRPGLDSLSATAGNRITLQSNVPLSWLRGVISTV